MSQELDGLWFPKKIPTYEITAEDALEEDVLPGVDLDHVPGTENSCFIKFQE